MARGHQLLTGQVIPGQMVLYVVFVFCFLSFPKDASRPAAHCSFSHDPRVIHEGSWRWMTYWVAPSEMAEREISNYLAEGATWCVIITDIYIYILYN